MCVCVFWRAVEKWVGLLCEAKRRAAPFAGPNDKSLGKSLRDHGHRRKMCKGGSKC